jgi:hypothetical protein
VKLTFSREIRQRRRSPCAAPAGQGQWVRPAHPAIDDFAPSGRQTLREELFRPFDDLILAAERSHELVSSVVT